MPGQTYQTAETVAGVRTTSLREPRHYSQNWQVNAADEVNGDAAAAGTAVASIQVPAGQTLYVFGVTAESKNGARTFLLVQSTTAAVGGVEVIQDVIDLAAAGVAALTSAAPPLAVINNTAGVAAIFCNLYIPQNRLGVAGNNAVGQFVAGSIRGVLE